MNLRLHITFRLGVLSLLLLLSSGTNLFAQVIANINATGTTGSYNTGSVSSTGTKNDDLMVTINQLANRGWAVFDLSSIPSGSTVNSVSLVFTTTPNTVLSTATNYIGGYQWSSADDPATVSGTTLYGLLNADGTTNFNASSWGANTTITKSLNASAVTLISTSLGGKVVMSFVRGSTNTYEIYGYGGTAAQQPQLIIDYLPSTPCSGTPAGGTAAANPTTACPTVPVALTVTGATAAGGLTYQWESSPAGQNTWQPISGATTPNYSTALTASTDFRRVLTCSGNSDTSLPVSVTMNSFMNCYCIPTTTNGCTSGDHVLNVQFASINNSTGQCLTASYSDYKTTVAAASIGTGQTYPITVHVNNGGTEHAAAWIDYNQSGTFDASEFIDLNTPSNSGSPDWQFDGMVTVPTTALTGNTVMRVRSSYSAATTAGSACATYSYGETEDYTVTIYVPSACTGSPVAGTATASQNNAPVTSVCSGSSFKLNLTGYTSGVSGLAFSWESSPAGVGIWTPISGATDPFYTVTPGPTTATDYHCVVTCTNGGGTDVSNVVAISISPFYICYCGPNSGVNNLNSISSNYLTNVNITGGTLNNTTTAQGPGSYSLYYPTTATTTDILYQGQQYTINTTHAFTGYYSDVWIDYDGDGTFSATEHITVTTANAGNSVNGTATFTVPYSAAVGLTGMRVRTYFTNNANACATNSSYETEDYVISIGFTASCTGTPTAGTLTGPASGTVCPNSPFTLTLNGVTIGVGISIQWQSSPAGVGIWQNISGATNPTYTDPGIITATDYQAVVTCANGGGQDISNLGSYSIAPWQNCYCTPTTGGGTTYYISNFTTTNAASNINNSSSSGTASGYHDYTGTPALIVVPGTTFNYSMNVAGGSTYGAAIWIDTNMDGTFQSAEQFLTTSSYAFPPFTGSITIPATVMTGTTRMRILAAFTPSNPTNPCLNGGSGEYQDYMINLFVPASCTGTPVAGTSYGVPDSICAGIPIMLSDTSATLATGITYQWQQSPHGAATWTDISGATTSSYNLTSGITTPTDFRLVVSCTLTGLGDTSTIEEVYKIYPPSQCYCTPTTTGGSTTYYISNFTTTGATSDINNSTTSGNAAGYKDLTATPALVATPGGVFNYSMNVAGGSTYGAAIWIDTNMDGTFQSNEQFLTTSAYAFPPITGTITLPVTATQGTTRMRILAAFTPSNPTNPCLNSGSGEFQDFTFIIGPPPTCPAPSGLTYTNATSTSVDLTWTSTATQWQIEYAPGNTFTLGSGTRVGPSGVTNPYTLSGLTGQQYSYFVRSICAPGDTSFWSQRQSFFPVPPNDLCVNAIDISNGIPASGYVSSATQSEPACDATVLANDVWYKFTTGSAATTAVINVNTALTGTDVVIQAFSGTCGTLTAMIPTSSSGTGTSGCVDGPAAGLETATYAVTPNTTYYVRVYGFNTFQGTFPIQLAVPPPNDDICNAINLVIDDPVPSCVNTQFATVGANDPSNACSSNNNTVWFKFTPTLSQVHYIVSTVPATSSDPLGAWIFTFTATGSCPGTLTLTPAGGIGTTCQSTQYPATPGGVTSFATASLTANTTYYLFVDGNSSDVGDLCFQVLSFPLSIKLADISASNLGGRNRINWNSASEERGDYYELERSADGNNFSKLSKIDGKGQASVYTYWDETPLSGINYYRLKMVDAAGNVAYSKVVTATVKGQGGFALEAFPNPVSDQLTVKAYGSNGSATVTITDATGKLVKVVSMDNGMALVDMKGLAQGMYLVKYADNEHAQTIKVNKQ